MSGWIAIVTGLLVGAAVYELLGRSLVRLAVGVVLLGHVSNLVLFAAEGVTRGGPPIVPIGRTMPPAAVADPLPQALILTAIVINFGLTAFMLVLAHRTHQAVGTDDLDRMRASDG
jgi:multicomponent Na+:H+ antiporter subunit C